MEELKKMLTEQTGVTDEQAGKSILIVKDYLKQRLPGIMHSQIDKIFEGNSLEENIRQKMEAIGNDVKSKVEVLASDLKNAFEGAFTSEKQRNKSN